VAVAKVKFGYRLSQRQTPNTKHQTPNTKHQTPNTKQKTIRQFVVNPTKLYPTPTVETVG
jgi:hypothetical protein